MARFVRTSNIKSSERAFPIVERTFASYREVPIDALFFEGLFEKKKQINVILGDRKTGFSNVNAPQRKVAEAIEAHCLGAKDRVRFELFGDHQPKG